MTSGFNTLPATIVPKSVMDENGNWIIVPHVLTRDGKGWHDRPATPLNLSTSRKAERDGQR